MADHHRILVQVVAGFGADPPAGLELELAYYAWRLGHVAEAEAAIARERALHPELEALLDRAARQIRTMPVMTERSPE